MMDIYEFYSKLDELFELDTGTVNGKECLSDNLLIDSLSMLGLISLLDKEYGIQMGPKEIIQIGTVDDLFRFISTNKVFQRV